MPDVRLIDANALMKNIGKMPQLRGITYGRMKKAVEETPTIDAVPVVHGRWKNVISDAIHPQEGECSVCKRYYRLAKCYDYCPNCGAKMDGGVSNGNQRAEAQGNQTGL